MSHDWERRWEMALWIDLARIQWKQCHDSTNSSRFYVVPWNYITGTSANTLKTSCWLESQHFQKLVEVRFWKICLVNQRTFQTMLWVTLSRKWANSNKKKFSPNPPEKFSVWSGTLKVEITSTLFVNCIMLRIYDGAIWCSHHPE